ncbi:MAG: hypothetical protein KA807_09735 [Prolixibacteraceae bacterium]|nr:hypothetical protein [Prolixibacteraceae bacterium]
MIGFKEQAIEFAKIFRNEHSNQNLSTGMEIINCNFESHYPFNFTYKGFVKGDLYYHELVQGRVDENFKFSYPIVVPDKTKKYNKAIILLHGLNERTWDKYFVWAKYLAEKTNRPVIMFPIAYHMNRSPKSWSDRRLMSELSNIRKRSEKDNNSTFANAALSTRLESHPELFFYSGLQTCYDIQQLLNEIKRGENNIFTPDTHLDIFAYSIGAFLSQILLLANPGGMFSTTRLFIFCGGPTFDCMYGNSKYIMDLRAFKSLLSLKKRKVFRTVKENLMISGDKNIAEAWNGLELMMHRHWRRKEREAMFNAIGERIKVVALEKDKVMPVKGIIRAMRGRKNNGLVPVEVIDFPFAYTHEQPFPMGDDKIQGYVDRCFTVVFDKVVNFFNFQGSEISRN